MSYDNNDEVKARFLQRLRDFEETFLGVETLPNFMVWTEDDDNQLDRHIASVWSWDEAVRLARGTAIIAGCVARIVVLS